jgi:hypothetical protein
MLGERARSAARNSRATWSLDNYRNCWLGLGFTEADLASGGSDRFIDAMVVWGDATTVKDKLCSHFAAGATHVCIQPVHEEGDFAARDRILTALADT